MGIFAHAKDWCPWPPALFKGQLQKFNNNLRRENYYPYFFKRKLRFKEMNLPKGADTWMIELAFEGKRYNSYTLYPTILPTRCVSNTSCLSLFQVGPHQTRNWATHVGFPAHLLAWVAPKSRPETRIHVKGFIGKCSRGDWEEDRVTGQVNTWILWGGLVFLRGDTWSKNGRKKGSQPNGYLGKNVLGKRSGQVNALCQDGDCLAHWRSNNKAGVAEVERVSGRSSRRPDHGRPHKPLRGRSAYSEMKSQIRLGKNLYVKWTKAWKV